MKRNLLFITMVWVISFTFCGSYLNALIHPSKLAPYEFSPQSATVNKSISKLPTDIAGMAGVTEKGPLNGPPVLVTSFIQFQGIFGGFLGPDWKESRFLAYAVQGFFENGGQKLYIKRVIGASPGSIPTVADYIGQDNGQGRRTGIQAFLDIDEIRIVAVPGIAATQVQHALLAHCDQAGNRFAVLDAPFQSSRNEVVSFRSQFNSPNGAMLF